VAPSRPLLACFRMDQPDPVAARLPVPLGAVTAISRQQMDYLMLAVLVRLQHLRHAEAQTLLDALIALGHRTPEVLMAKAVVENEIGNHADVLATLTQLDRIDPPQFREGRKADPRVRMRSFLQARATYALRGELDAEGAAALDFYLRQGRGSPPP
jgi:hypothetical protein